MKRQILLISLLILSGILWHNNAQSQNKSPLGFGLRTGVNIADYTNSRGDARSGFTIGGYTDLHLTDRFALELSGYYSEQGSYDILPVDYPTIRVDNNLDYVQFLFGPKWNLIGGFRAFSMLGVDLLVNSHSNVRSVTSPPVHYSRSPLEDTNKTLLNITAGVGYTFKFGLDLQASYTHGLSPIIANSEHYTSMYRVTIGWRIFRGGALR